MIDVDPIEIDKANCETLKHINEVRKNLFILQRAIYMWSHNHDSSKLSPFESRIFAKFTPLLKSSTYGSNEYKKMLNDMKPALDHHYERNRHHPEHFKNGIAGMTLVDVIEMFCDWVAATERHEDGDIFKSLEINRKRFAMSNQLYEIFKNTAIVLKEERNKE